MDTMESMYSFADTAGKSLLGTFIFVIVFIVVIIGITSLFVDKPKKKI